MSDDELTTKEPVPVDNESDGKKNDDIKDLDKDQHKVDRVEEMEAQQAADSKDSKETTTTTTAPNNDGDVPPTPPPKPPRPASPFEQAQQQLKEAFPDTDASVIRAVLVASGGQLDPAFNALLAMSDPNFKPDNVAPPPPPKAQSQQPQIEEDEKLARQLAREYNPREHRYPPPPPGYRSSHGERAYSSSRVRQGSGYSGRYDDERHVQRDEHGRPYERSFIDDDLPEIRDNLQKGFEETREKVTSWVTNLKKRLDGDEAHGGVGGGGSGSGSGSPLFGALGRSSGEQERRSSPQPQGYGYDQRRQQRRGYDRDPTEISNDFQGISLRDDDNGPPPSKPPRPQQNQQPAPGAVSAFGEPKPTTATSTTTAKASKWEPLKSSNNEVDNDKDPFFIGESDDDEEDAKKTTATDDKKADK